MARYTKVLKSLAHNAVGDRRIQAAVPAGNNYYVTGGTYDAGNQELDFVGTAGFTPFSVDVSALIDDTNNYVTGATFGTGDGILTLARNGGLADVTVDLDGRYAYATDIAGAANRVAYFSDADSVTGSSNLTFDGTTLTYTSTDAGSAAGPELDLFRNSASPAAADYIGQVRFLGESSTGVQRTYAKITGKIGDPTNSTEDGIIEMMTRKNGSNNIAVRLTDSEFKIMNDTDFSVDTSTLYVDSTNNRVGILNDSPAYELDLNGRFFLDGGHFRGADTNGPSMRDETPSATNPVFTFNNDVTTGMGRAAAGTLSFITEGRETVRMASDANYTKLFIGGDSTLGFYRYNNRMDFYISSNPRMHLDAGKLYSATSGGPLLDLTPTSGEANYGFVDDANTGMSRTGADTLVLMTAGTTALTVDSSQVTTFANTPVVGTMTSSDNSTKAASTAFVKAQSYGTGTIGGSVSDNNIPIGTAANTIGDFSPAYSEGTNIIIGRTGQSTTTDADDNTIYGYNAGYALTDGDRNVLIGRNAAEDLTTGISNVAIGRYAMQDVTTDSYNVAIGTQAGNGVTGGGTNVGHQAGNNSGSRSTSFGYQALLYPDGNYNTAIGYHALKGDATTQTAHSNVAIGYAAAGNITSGYENFFGGFQAGQGITSGYRNEVIGYRAGYNLASGKYNQLIGYNAGHDLTTSGNTMIGYSAGASVAGTSGYITAIGYQALGAGTGGTYDVAIGFQAHYNGTGRGVFIGLQAGKETTGAGVAIGSEAGETNTNGGLTLIGENAGKAVSGTATGMTAVGHNVSANASGTYHTMVGQNAGQYLKGNVNTGVGYRVLQSGTNATHQNNTGLGYQVLQGGNYSVTNQDNVAIGVNTMRYASGSSYNVAIGNSVMGAQDQQGSENVAIGREAMLNSTGGDENTAVGSQAGYSLSTGDYNVAIGSDSLRAATTANYNIAIGKNSMNTGVTTSPHNIGIGYQANKDVAGGSGYNIAIGAYAGQSVTTSAHNIFIGREAGINSDGVNHVIGIGYEAAKSLTTASNAPIMIGVEAGEAATTARDAVVIGYTAGKNAADLQYKTLIGSQAGSSASGATASGAIAIGHFAGTGINGLDSIAIGRYTMRYGPADGSDRNIAIGRSAMQGVDADRLVGDYNIAIGYQAMRDIKNADNNIAIGLNSMVVAASDTLDQTLNNVAIGKNTLYEVTSDHNIAIGYQAGRYITTSPYNIGIGVNAIRGDSSSKLTGTGRNVAIGYEAMSQGYTTARYNVAIGFDAMATGTTASGNTAIGYAAMENAATTTEHNVAVGWYAGREAMGNHNTIVGSEAHRGVVSTSTGQQNVAIGRQALYAQTTSSYNTAVGYQAADSQTTGGSSVALGWRALSVNSTGSRNVAVGYESLKNTAKDGNVGLGYQAGINNTTGTGNVYIGDNAGPSSTSTASNELYIHNAAGTPLIGGDFSAGTVTINGVLSATAKSFNIAHPLYKDKRLVHGSLEGPEHGIYIRGTIEATEGCVIELPEYWQALCDEYTVQLTPHGPYTVFIQEKQKDKVMVASSSKDYKFDYFIVGKRTDEEFEVVQDA